MYLTTKEVEKYVNGLFKKNPKSKQEVKALYPNLSKDHIDRIYARYMYLKENGLCMSELQNEKTIK